MTFPCGPEPEEPKPTKVDLTLTLTPIPFPLATLYVLYIHMYFQECLEWAGECVETREAHLLG